MQLYLVGVRGGLKKIKNAKFAENEVYLIDDIKTIYLWIGDKIPKNRKDISIKKAELLNNKQENPVPIQVIDQRKEFGAFLAIKDFLRGGSTPTERRSELEIDYEDTMELIDLGIEPDLEGEITLAAHKLSQKKKHMKNYAKNLQKIQIQIMKGKKPTQAEVKKKSKEIFESSSTYEELCWLIAEMGKLIEKESLS